MSSLIDGLNEKVRTSSNAAGLVALKLAVAGMVGLTLALIGDEIIKYGWFSFLFVILATVAALWRVMRAWRWTQVMIFILFCVLIGLLLRMYILIAPG